MERGICVRGLKKSFKIGKQKQVTDVLCGLDFDMQSKEFCAVMGSSGCGKSTFLNILCGLERPDGGSCMVDGKQLERMSKRELAAYRNQKIGIVFQGFYLDETRSLLDNVAMPGGYAGLSFAERRKRALALLDYFGLTEEQKKRPSQVSGGQKQRAAIARALMNQPDYLLADEPTGSLDEENTEKVMELFASLHESGMGILLVTHDIQVAGYAQRVVTMRQGKI